MALRKKEAYGLSTLLEGGKIALILILLQP